MKRLIYLFIPVLFIPSVLKADLISKPGAYLTLSFELVGSYEIQLSSYNSFSIWGGGGALVPLIENPPALGYEIGIELRQYFKEDMLKGFNLGLYSGFAFMRAGDLKSFEYGIYGNKAVGFVPGIKLTYKAKQNKYSMIEPYISFSYPSFGEKISNIDFNGNYTRTTFTLGIRVGINYISSSSKD